MFFLPFVFTIMTITNSSHKLYISQLYIPNGKSTNGFLKIGRSEKYENQS
jgi:hypothetical protein